MQQETPRRERRIAARRQQIIDAAIKVFGEKGYQRATTKEIAEAADVAEGTIYNYFSSKEDLLLAIIDQTAQLGWQQAVFAEAVDHDLRTFIHTYLLRRLQMNAPVQEVLISILPELFVNPELRARYTADFVQPALAMIEGHIRERAARGHMAEMDAALLTRLMVALLFGLEMLSILDDPVARQLWREPERMADAVTALLMDGLHRHE